jgi:hypothetical protein
MRNRREFLALVAATAVAPLAVAAKDPDDDLISSAVESVTVRYSFRRDGRPPFPITAKLVIDRMTWGELKGVIAGIGSTSPVELRDGTYASQTLERVVVKNH